MLEVVMEKFQKATKNNMLKVFVDQLQHVTDRIDQKEQESLREVGPEVVKCNLDLTLIRIECL